MAKHLWTKSDQQAEASSNSVAIEGWLNPDDQRSTSFDTVVRLSHAFPPHLDLEVL